MDIDGIVQEITMFTQNNIIVSAVIGIFLLFLLFRQFKIFLGIVLFFMAAYGLARLFKMLSAVNIF